MPSGRWRGCRCPLPVITGPRPSTLRGYAAHVRLYLVPYLGQILLADLSAAHVQAMFTAIARQHAAAGTPIAPATLARVKATLRAALNAAIRAGRITVNPASRAELPPARRPRAVVWTGARVEQWQRTGIRPAVAVWTPAQTAAFLNAIRGHRLDAAYHLIALRGLRRGEACGLRWCDIDLDAATAVISWQLQQYGGHITLCPPKTARSERIIALDSTTVAALRTHRAGQQADQAVLGEEYHDSGYVISSLNGDPLAPDRLSRYFRQLSAAAGLPPIRLHDLRHGAATLAQVGCGRGPEGRPGHARAFQHRAHRRHLHLGAARGGPSGRRRHRGAHHRGRLHDSGHPAAPPRRMALPAATGTHRGRGRAQPRSPSLANRLSAPSAQCRPAARDGRHRPGALSHPALRSSRQRPGAARAPKACAHTLVNPCPYREAAMRSRIA
jgi:integrase